MRYFTSYSFWMDWDGMGWMGNFLIFLIGRLCVSSFLLLCLLEYHTRAQIKDPEKVTNKMYGCNTDISSHFFRIFNLHPSSCVDGRWKGG